MSEHLTRAQAYQNNIRKILFQDWDPIGVSHIPEAQDEYDSYVGGVYSRLIRTCFLSFVVLTYGSTLQDREQKWRPRAFSREEQ